MTIARETFAGARQGYHPFAVAMTEKILAGGE